MVHIQYRNIFFPIFIGIYYPPNYFSQLVLSKQIMILMELYQTCPCPFHLFLIQFLFSVTNFFYHSQNTYLIYGCDFLILFSLTK